VLRNDDAIVPTASPTTVLMREPPHRRRGLAYTLLALATLGVFIVALVAARGLLNNTTTDVSTPNLLHQTLEDAQSTLTSQGLTLGKVTYRYTGKDNKGEVIGQFPQAGLLRGKGQTVDLTVSNGIRIVTMPGGLVGQTLAGAKATLLAAGLNVGTIVPKNSSAPANQVLGSRPAAGTTLPANSSVTLVVSNAHVKVPDVTGDDPSTASGILLQDGFNPQIKRSAVYTKANDGTIVSQTPSGNTFATAGSTVIIYLDKKPPPPVSPTPTSNPTGSPTITPTGTPTP
jgi:eukaryotic-like serine/threonine-protein kinase